MRRWNGWGDDSYTYHLPETALEKLTAWVGESQPQTEAPIEQVLRSVPPSRLPAHPLVDTGPKVRLRHALGQSFPDWIAWHSGRILAFPDGVAYPTSDIGISSLIAYAKDNDVKLIPYGGGTSVVGHINPQPGIPTLTVDLGCMNHLLDLDEKSLLATFGAGVAGPELEARLQEHGYTLGHFPQSFEYSTLGGWIASRSSGQQSLRYGRIEKLFAGGRMLSPSGKIDLPPFPASAAGPDVRELVLGSEGRLGIITQATVRVTPRPEKESFHAVFFPDFERGQAAVRDILQSGLPLCMLRLSTAVETATTLALAGHATAIGILEKVLALAGMREEKSMLLLGFSGISAVVDMARGEALHLCSHHKGLHIGTVFGSQWHKNRFRTPYLRNTLWELGYGIDTLETATTWSKVDETLAAMEVALKNAITDTGEKVHVFTHLSHNYPTGSSIYTTYLFRLDQDPDVNLERWNRLKAAASQAVVAHGGTISHQHGVGVDHALYLPAEKGELGMKAIREMAKAFDPDGMMNPGKLFQE